MTHKIKKLKLKEKERLKEINIDQKSNSTLEQKKAKVALYMARGLDIKDACTLAKCSDASLKALRSDPRFEQFVQECIANTESEYLSSVQAAAQMGEWQAASWFLERRYPDKYGKRDIVRHEYIVKLETFQKVVLKVINEADPYLKLKIVKELRNYNFDGADLMDHAFIPTPESKMLPDPHIIPLDEDIIDIGSNEED